MPFGYVNARSIYKRAPISKVYLDDVLRPAKTLEEVFAKLELVLATLATEGFTLNYEKCHFIKNSIEYLGFVIETGQVRPNELKTQPLIN